MSDDQTKTKSKPLLQLEGITKTFPGVKALDDVQMSVHAGEIHGLLGENGAGKSTLMKILNGVHDADGGTIQWQGEKITISSPQDAQQRGISMIHQELALVPYMNAGKNIFLGREPGGIIPGMVNWRKLYSDAEAITSDLGLDIDVRRPVRFFSIAQQQMIEVAKALSMDAQLLIMDEPTSSITDREVDTLFEQMRRLRDQGVAIIFISHRLEEVFEICDRVTVLRDGQHVATSPVAEVDSQTLIKQMVGRQVDEIYERQPRDNPPSDDVLLEVKSLSRGDKVKDIGFRLHKGEILGIAGLVGAGRTELVETIFGVYPPDSGTLHLNGDTVTFRHPGQAIERGIGFVPENRKEQGLFPLMTVSLNLLITRLGELARVIIPWNKVTDEAEQYIDKLDIRTPSPEQQVANLSGGNQQKVIIARWLTRNPQILILDEPTRGIDVGAKSEIHRLMRNLASDGVGIIMVSSELPEVLGVSDRILVMHEGRIAGEFDPDTATQDDLLSAATGTRQEATTS